MDRAMPARRDGRYRWPLLSIVAPSSTHESSLAYYVSTSRVAPQTRGGALASSGARAALLGCRTVEESSSTATYASTSSASASASTARACCAVGGCRSATRRTLPARGASGCGGRCSSTSSPSSAAACAASAASAAAGCTSGSQLACFETRPAGVLGPPALRASASAAGAAARARASAAALAAAEGECCPACWSQTEAQAVVARRPAGALLRSHATAHLPLAREG